MVYKVWGGSQLASLKGLGELKAGSEPLGETWEISIHKDGPSLLGGSPLNNEVSQEQMPYLVKLIDTSDNLSVQVHPDDDFAKAHENSSGKTECWIILGAEKGAGIYLGMKPGVTKEEFEKGILTGEEMNRYLVFHEVEVGDFFFVPAGAIHAIGTGVLLAEVQQSSGITYRVWDWNRLDDKGNSRELHIEKAMKVTRFGDEFNSEKTFKKERNIFQKGISQVVTHPQFCLRQVTLDENETIELDLNECGRVKGILNLNGSLEVEGVKLDPYKAALSSSSRTKLNVKAKESGSFLLVE